MDRLSVVFLRAKDVFVFLIKFIHFWIWFSVVLIIPLQEQFSNTVF